MSNKGAERKSPVVVQGCLTALRTLSSSPFLEDEDVGSTWRELLKSALITVLQNAKPSMSLFQSSNLIVVERKVLWPSFLY